MRSPENTLIEQPKSFENLKTEIFEFLLPNLDSNMADDVIEYFDKNKLNNYSLAKAFLAIMSGKELPEQANGELFDTEDGKIEKFIDDLIINIQEKAS